MKEIYKIMYFNCKILLKDRLIEEVINQIDADINLGNLEALYELLDKLDIKYLEAYLPEDSLKLSIPNG